MLTIDLSLFTEDWEGPDVTMQDDTSSTKASTSSAGNRKPKAEAQPKQEEPDSEPSSDGSDEYNPEEHNAPKVCLHVPAHHAPNNSFHA